MNLWRMYWKRSLQRPGAVLLWLAIPFVFMTIYTLVFGNDTSAPLKTGLAIVDRDSTFASRLVGGAFSQGPVGEMINLIEAADSAAVERLFAAQDASAALVIPDGFGDRLIHLEADSLLLLTNPRHTIGPLIAESVVGGVLTLGNGLLGQFSVPVREIAGAIDREEEPNADDVARISRGFFAAGSGSRGLRSLQSISVDIVKDEKDDEPDDFNMAALFFPGLVMFGLLSVSLHLEHRFLTDRTRHVTRRIVTSPVSPWRIAIEQRLYTASFIYAVGVMAGLLAGIIWQIPPRGLATANLITIALALFVSGINGAIFSISNSVRAVGAISSITMIFLAILGGGFFPAEFTPPAFQAIVKWIPTGMANLGLTHALTGRDAGISIPLLYAYCLGFFVVGIIATRRRVM